MNQAYLEIKKIINEDFVNQDGRCASNLASFADDMLRNTLKDVSESESEIQLQRFIELFRYLKPYYLNK